MKGIICSKSTYMKLIKSNIPFTMVANEILRSTELSWKAKGLYAYLFSKPNEWDFSSNRIVLESADGRTAITSALRELESSGCLKRNKRPDGKMDYILKHSTLSQETELRLEEPKSGFPSVGKPLSGETRLISNIVLDTNKEDTSNGVPSQDVQSFIDMFKGVNPNHEILFHNKTERASADRLLKKFGLNKMTSTLERLPDIINQPYAPKITTPYELEKNMGKLIAFVTQNKNLIAKKKSNVV